MKLILTIDGDGAAFDEDRAAEVARILRAAAAKFENGSTDFSLLDINGNRVGEITLGGR